jgi:hypothetical protein
MGWDGMGWDGMGWDGMGWDGMGWDGMGWARLGLVHTSEWLSNHIGQQIERPNFPWRTL